MCSKFYKLIVMPGQVTGFSPSRQFVVSDATNRDASRVSMRVFLTNFPRPGCKDDASYTPSHKLNEREFFVDDLLVRSHFIIEATWWTGLAP